LNNDGLSGWGSHNFLNHWGWGWWWDNNCLGSSGDLAEVGVPFLDKNLSRLPEGHVVLFELGTSGLTGIQSIGQVRDLNGKALNIGSSISNSLVQSSSLVGEGSISLLKLTTSDLVIVAFDGDAVLGDKPIIELLAQTSNGLVQSGHLVR
jgi:hypothetical protein